MTADSRLARDPALLDAIDAFKRDSFDAEVWRVVREGRDPALGSPSQSRWCDGSFDVLYTSLEREGAMAEIHALLSLQPVFPSKTRWFAHRLKVLATETLRLADLPTLEKLGVDVVRYADRNYVRTQEVAEAAYFLGFDGLVAPSARWTCLNCVLFTDRVAPDQIATADQSEKPVNWAEWKKTRR